MQPAPEVSEAEIARLVDAFYRRVRADPVLAPVFVAALGEGEAEWAAHAARLCRFWSSLMRRSGAYHGDPYSAHLRLPGLTPDMFAHWLDLFATTCTEQFPPGTAAAFIERAERVARSLRVGIFERSA
jgi:hemoglobin